MIMMIALRFIPTIAEESQRLCRRKRRAVPTSAGVF